MIVGSGVDVIEIARIERALAQGGTRFQRRVFSEREIEAWRHSARPVLHYAVGFAAKEAAMKAAGTGWAQGVRWVEIEVLPAPEPTRALRLEWTGRAAELARARGAERSHLAVSRSRSHALALVLLEGVGG